ncbi:hypothetical protein E5288_WYG009715 [Bos mutus]|uniref:Uncharacterized protein n=1 Tax=Bos mutus TaxID=72004 RepID=A0A6B0QY99_9CETA|nr:hypothetical protein [Bos mutus]
MILNTVMQKSGSGKKSVPSQLENVDPSSTGQPQNFRTKGRIHFGSNLLEKGVNRKSREITHPFESDELVQGHWWGRQRLHSSNTIICQNQIHSQATGRIDTLSVLCPGMDIRS